MQFGASIACVWVTIKELYTTTHAKLTLIKKRHKIELQNSQDTKHCISECGAKM